MALEKISDTQRQAMLSAMLALEANLVAPPSVEELADSAGMSAFHFHRMFRTFIGEPPASYAARLRLELAANWLMYTERPAVDIATAIGYDSREGFVRAFSRRMGRTPESFREAAIKYRDSVARRLQDHPPLTVNIVERPARRIAFLRSMSSTTSAILRAWWRFLKAIRTVDGFEPAQILGINYDDEFVTPRWQQRYDVACELPNGMSAPVAAPAPLCERSLPGGLYAVVEFEGSVAELVHAWEWLMSVWLPSSPWQLRDWHALDLFAPDAIPRSWLSLLKLATAPIRSRLCVPVQHHPTGHLPTLS